MTANIKKTAVKRAVQLGKDIIHLAGPTILLVRDAELVKDVPVNEGSLQHRREAQIKGRVFECVCSSAGLARNVVYKELSRVLSNFPHLSLPSAILASKEYLEANRRRANRPRRAWERRR